MSEKEKKLLLYGQSNVPECDIKHQGMNELILLFGHKQNKEIDEYIYFI